MSLVPILRCWKWSGLLVRKAVTIARIPRVSEKYKSECIEFNYSNNTLQWTEHSAIFSEVQPRNQSQKKQIRFLLCKRQINFLNKVSRTERKWEETRKYIYFLFNPPVCSVNTWNFDPQGLHKGSRMMNLQGQWWVRPLLSGVKWERSLRQTTLLKHHLLTVKIIICIPLG